MVENLDNGIIYRQRNCMGARFNEIFLTPAAKNLLKQTSNSAIASSLFTGTTSQYVRGDGSLATLTSSSFAIGYPTSRSLALATAYQCTDNTKPCAVTLTVRCPITLSLLVGATCEGEVRVGNSTSVATGGGTNIAPIYRNASGILGLSTNDSETKTINVPAGGYFAIRQTTGTVNIVAAFDQSLGN